MDRNLVAKEQLDQGNPSLSARRAWIEIRHGSGNLGGTSVALRKESVDRNCPACGREIVIAVALRKESVDRNRANGLRMPLPTGRSPQGERG